MRTLLKCAVFFLVAFATCFASSDGIFAGEPASLKVKAGKEILVAKDIDIAPPVWCRGGEILAYLKKNAGLFYYETKTGKTTFVANDFNVPNGCTPDGEWLVYSSGPDGMWRYEFKTGKRQRFRVSGDGVLSASDDKASPSTGKINLYVYGDQDKVSEMLETSDPKWEIVRIDRFNRYAALRDGSAYFDTYRDSATDRIALIAYISIPEKKTVKISHPLESFRIILVDKQNRLIVRTKDRIARCEVDIKEGKLSCRTALVFAKEPWLKGEDYGFFSDGETMAFSVDRDKCVRKMHVGDWSERAPCITGTAPDDTFISYSALSSDDKWLAYEVVRKWPDGKYGIIDLYVLQLND